MDRREFLTGAAGFMVAYALPAPTRLGDADVVSLRESVVHFYKLDHLHGSGSVYSATAQTFQRLRSLVEHASYGQATGRTLRELAAETAQHAGWVAFDADLHDDAQRWWLEAMKWSRLAESDSVGVTTMARMAVHASWQERPRETIDLATAAQRAGVMTPRLTSWLLACEAVGHAGVGDAASAHAALRRARTLADQPRHDDDPRSLDHYGPAAFTFHEQRVALLLGDLSAAEDRARTMLALGDQDAYPRNHALYLTRLADVLAQRRKIDEGAAAVKQATVAAAGLSSPRVTRELRAVTQSLAPFFKGEP